MKRIHIVSLTETRKYFTLLLKLAAQRDFVIIADNRRKEHYMLELVHPPADLPQKG